MVKAPQDFRVWLRYHHSIGVSRFIVWIDADPKSTTYLTTAQQITSTIPSEHLIIRSVTEFNTTATNTYDTVMQKQNAVVNQTIQMLHAGRVGGVLFFIDDDELIYTPTFDLDGTLRAGLTGRAWASGKIPNIEARPDDPRATNLFSSVRYFECDTSRFDAYTNGKSFANLDHTGDLRLLSPHDFSGPTIETWRAGAYQNYVWDVDLTPLLILHYDSVTYGKWLAKFDNAVQNTTEQREQVFPFYNTSFDLVAHKERQCTAYGDRTNECRDALELARSYFLSKKVIPTVLQSDTIVDLTAVQRSVS